MTDETTFDLTPPEPEPTLIERLAHWDIVPVYDNRLEAWTLPGVSDSNSEPMTLSELLDDDGEADKRLGSRDQFSVTKLINDVIANNYPGPEIDLDRERWETRFDRYSTDYGRTAGPAWDVKLHDTYEFWRRIEKKLDLDVDEYEIDRDAWIWSQVIRDQYDWYMETVLPEDYPALDPSKFELAGRSGGHLVYNISHREYEETLTLTEAEDLEKLAQNLPEAVRGTAMEVVAQQWTHGLNSMWEDEIEEWEQREAAAVAEAVRRNDMAAAARHQANLDAPIPEVFDAFDLVWNLLYEDEK